MNPTRRRPDNDNTMPNISVLVIDKHPVDALGVRNFLCGTEFQVLEILSDLKQMESVLAEQTVDLILCEMELPHALELPEQLARRGSEARIVYFSANRNPVLLNEARKAKCGGALDKGISRDELLSSLRSVMQTGSCWTRTTSRQIVGALSADRVDISKEAALTRKEHAVLLHIANGMTNQNIADQIGISYETVKEHVQNILRKLHVTDRTQAAIWMIRQQEDSNGHHG